MTLAFTANPRLANTIRRQSAAAAEAFDASDERLAWPAAQWRAQQDDPHRSLLVLRFALVNVLGFALLSLAYAHGLVDRVLLADETNLSLIIFLVFLGGLGLCGRRILRTSRELNLVRDFDPLVESKAGDYLAKLRGCPGDSRAILAGALRLKLSHGVSGVRHIAGSLVLLGLIGTVIGFIIALSGVDPDSASDIDAIAPMVSTLIAGMSTALYTTLVGSILNLWLMVNCQLLADGVVKLIAAIQELGERHARS